MTDHTDTPETELAEAIAAQPERGASLIEYALLVALIAVVCIAAVGLLGSETTIPYSAISSGIAN